jgi:hypothetical protein
MQRRHMLGPQHWHPLPSIFHAETYSLSAIQCSADANTSLHRDTGTPQLERLACKKTRFFMYLKFLMSLIFVTNNFFIYVKITKVKFAE